MKSLQSTKLFPPQAELLKRGYLGSVANWVIYAPTGAGKTLMAEWAMNASLQKGLKSSYVAPLKAIVEEKNEEWSQKYFDWTIGIFTGESTRKSKQRVPGDENIMLFTPEKLAAYLFNWKLNLRWLAKLDVLVLDEVHLLGDGHRGATLEAMIGRLQRINPFVRFICLSGTISNAQEIAKWLKAELYVTDWKPVPIEHRIERFKKVSQKLDLLHKEICSTLKVGGKVLVFVNSRKRSEQLDKQLKKHGILSDYNHAGMNKEARRQTQTAMRNGEIDVLVSTSTLEMGVNFPARKVVIYDAYEFNGENFNPLSIRRYQQFAGRAGRAGFDDQGESVLFLPQWVSGGVRYLHDSPEPVRSSFFNKQNLLREILVEVAGRLSISEKHLEVNFTSRTFWRMQDGLKCLRPHVQKLIQLKLLRECDKVQTTYLQATLIGKVAAQMSLSPLTVGLLCRFESDIKQPTEFDTLLLACYCTETTPKLGFRFEEIDFMTDDLLRTPSHLLDKNPEWFFDSSQDSNKKRLLSAVKCAMLIHQHIEGQSTEELAERYDAYPYDILLLKEHLGWVLDGALRIFSVLLKSEDKEKKNENVSSPHMVCVRTLKQMVKFGIPRESLGLVKIQGIGSRRARKLIANKFINCRILCKSKPEKLSFLLKLKHNTIEKILQLAKEVKDHTPVHKRKNEKLLTREKNQDWCSWGDELDPYRLRRAFELKVDFQSVEVLQISGGAEPHTVRVLEDSKRMKNYICDCMDFQKGTINCKHIIRSKLERHDQQLENLLGRWKECQPESLRYSIGELWMNTGTLYDSIAGRNGDYQGAKFIKKISKKKNRR